jgi:hypothetical protein
VLWHLLAIWLTVVLPNDQLDYWKKMLLGSASASESGRFTNRGSVGVMQE